MIIVVRYPTCCLTEVWWYYGMLVILNSKIRSGRGSEHIQRPPVSYRESSMIFLLTPLRFLVLFSHFWSYNWNIGFLLYFFENFSVWKFSLRIDAGRCIWRNPCVTFEVPMDVFICLDAFISILLHKNGNAPNDCRVTLYNNADVLLGLFIFFV